MGIETAIIAAAVAGAATGIYSGQRQASETKKATQAAQVNAEKQATMMEQEMNKRNAKTPNASLLYNNPTSQNNNTMLSGVGGVEPGALDLQRKTLLGQ